MNCLEYLMNSYFIYRLRTEAIDVRGASCKEIKYNITLKALNTANEYQ